MVVLIIDMARAGTIGHVGHDDMDIPDDRILVADDDPAMLRLLTKWLESAGYTVDPAGDGREAIAVMEERWPSIVITDWEMIGMDGRMLCEWLRAQKTPHYIYTIFLTNHTSLENMIAGFKAGADDFLRKPIDRSELLARLQAARRFLQLERRLEDLTGADPLTGMATHRSLYESMQTEWSRQKSTVLSLCCVMIDIDNLHDINNQFGHRVGDEVIRRLAETMSGDCPEEVTISRYGGEEFCATLWKPDLESAGEWAEAMRRRIAEREFFVSGKSIKVTASFGVAQRQPDMASPQNLVESAEGALLIAKRTGRNRVVQSARQPGQSFAAEADWIESNMARLVARDVMTTIVCGIHKDETVAAAARYMLRFRIGTAPVIDDSGRMVGILSDRDLALPELWRNWNSTFVRDVMKRNVVAYSEDSPAEQTFDFLSRASIRNVVVTRNGRPVGMVGRPSLLRWFMNANATGNGPSEAECNDDDGGQRHRIVMAANRLAWEAGQLAERVCCNQNDSVPCVIGSASRMQELLNDLLASTAPVSRDSQCELALNNS